MLKKLSMTLLFVLVSMHVSMAQDTRQVVTPTQIFQEGFIQVMGRSASGQDEYSAITAARATAQGTLLQTVQGLNLTQDVTVAKGVTLSNTIETHISGSLMGAYVVNEEYNESKGSAKVWMRLNLKGQGSLYESMTPVIQQLPTMLDKQSLAAFKPQEGNPATQSFDGVIIDVRGLNFKPALANRILTESQDVLFEPSKVSPQMLIERGCGGYTTTVDKAKALLSTWGSNTPMVVKCSRVIKGTEAVVSVNDAAAIFEQDQKTNILPQAKVVFVL